MGPEKDNEEILSNCPENWSARRSTPIWGCSLIVIGAFFLLNVILAVLAEALTKVDQIEKN